MDIPEYDPNNRADLVTVQSLMVTKTQNYTPPHFILHCLVMQLKLRDKIYYMLFLRGS